MENTKTEALQTTLAPDVVERAYREGHEDGSRPKALTSNIDRDWETSDTYAALQPATQSPEVQTWRSMADKLAGHLNWFCMRVDNGEVRSKKLMPNSKMRWLSMQPYRTPSMKVG